MPDESPERKPGRADDVNWGHFLGVGLQMLVGALLGYFIGNWLDRRYGWEPWGVLIGVMLGVAAGMYLLIKDAIRINRD
jgi:F0F1-type ATP synthase assembly protein I